MKKLVILLVLFLLLGGGGGASWWFLMREAPEEGVDPEIAEEVSTSLAAVSQVIRLDPIVLPIIREGRVTVHVTAVVVLELTEAMDQSDLHALADPLRNALLSELYGIYAVRYVQERGFNIPVVRKRLIVAVEEVLGAGTIKTIRLQDINKRAPTNG
jgi:flagellar FliL protein